MITIQLLDENGNDILSDRMSVMRYDGEFITIRIKDEFTSFSDDDLRMFSYLLERAIDYGGTPKKMKTFLELYDKISAIREKRME